MTSWKIFIGLLALGGMLGVLSAEPTAAESATPRAPEGLDPATRVLVLPNSHLDTLWMWTARESILRHLPKTIDDNAALFSSFPGYRFGFEQAIHHRWLEELDPERFELVRRWAREGRWWPLGGAIVAGDVNLPSPESLVRQHLLGTRYFEERFGVRNTTAFLPDCFGFGAAFPAVLRHLGMDGLFTGKVTMTWAGYRPFPAGRWVGMGGHEVIAVLNPGYGGRWTSPLAADLTRQRALQRAADESGAPVATATVGRGDDGGAPDPGTVARVLEAVEKGPGKVELATPEQMVGAFREHLDALPVHHGDLLLRRHGTGSWVSHAEIKRLDRIADEGTRAAEVLAVLAHALVGRDYPREELRDLWWRILWHHFHDDLPGTSIPQAHHDTWNDLYLASQIARALADEALGALAAEADLSGDGTPLVVGNPNGEPFSGLIEVIPDLAGEMAFPGVRAPDGSVRPAQLLETLSGGERRLAVPVDLPPLGFAVVHLVDAGAPAGAGQVEEALGKTAVLESDLLRVEVGEDGDIVSIRDLRAGREWLAGAAGIRQLEDSPEAWPAWEIDGDDLDARPLSWDEVRLEVGERGPLRRSVRVARRAPGVEVVQEVGLDEGAMRVDLRTEVTLLRKGVVLVLDVPFAVPSPGDEDPTFHDLGIGAWPRKRFAEGPVVVPAQQWSGVEAPGEGGIRLGVAHDRSSAWQRRADGTLRLVLVRNPDTTRAAREAFEVLEMQDLGTHRFRSAIVGGSGRDWHASGIPREAAFLNRPPVAIALPQGGAAGSGRLGRTGSLVEGPAPGLLALKLAEDGDSLVARWVGGPEQEPRFAGGWGGGRFLDGRERPLSPGEPTSPGGLTTRSYHRVRPFDASRGGMSSTSLALPFGHDGVAGGERTYDGSLPGAEVAFPAEYWPARLRRDGVTFHLGPAHAGARNLLVPDRQVLKIPDPGSPGRRELRLLGGTLLGEQVRVSFLGGSGEEIGAETVLLAPSLKPVGRFWDPVVPGRPVFDMPPQPTGDLKEGWTPARDLRPAWVTDHLRDARGWRPLEHGILFERRLALPEGTREVVLGVAPRAWIAAVSVVDGAAPRVHPATATEWP